MCQWVLLLRVSWRGGHDWTRWSRVGVFVYARCYWNVRSGKISDQITQAKSQNIGLLYRLVFSMLWYRSMVSGEVAVIDLYMVKWCLIDDRRSGVQTRRSELSWSNTRDERKLMPCLIASVPSMAANTRHHDIFLPACVSLEFGVYPNRTGCEFLRRLCCGHRVL